MVSAQDSFRRLYIKSSSACCGSQTSITFYTSLMGVRTVFQNILVSRRVQVCSRYSFKTTIGLIRRHLEQKPGPSPVWFHYWSLQFARRMFLAVFCLSVAAVSAQAPVPCSKYMYLMEISHMTTFWFFVSLNEAFKFWRYNLFKNQFRHSYKHQMFRQTSQPDARCLEF